MSSFAQNITGTRNETIFLVRGGRDHTGQPAWYFIRVDGVKTKAFLREIKGGNIELAAFGEIVESGYGKEPPPAVIAYMKANYSYTG